MRQGDTSAGDQPKQEEVKPAALCFVGPIDRPWTQSLRNMLCAFANDGVTHLSLYMSSSGGSMVEGFALYNLINSLPMRIHTHNIGAIQSIANIVFIAGHERTAAPQSSFMFHGFSWTFVQETLDEAQIAERTRHLATGRTEFMRIFEERTRWSPVVFEERKLFDRANVIGPEEAVDAGIVQDIQHLTVARGTRIVNVVEH